MDYKIERVFKQKVFYDLKKKTKTINGKTYKMISEEGVMA